MSQAAVFNKRHGWVVILAIIAILIAAIILAVIGLVRIVQTGFLSEFVIPISVFIVLLIGIVVLQIVIALRFKLHPEWNSIQLQPIREIQVSEELLRLFLEYCPIYVFFKDEHGRSLLLSKNFEKMLGRPMDQLIGKTMTELFPGELGQHMTDDDMRILREGKVINVVEEMAGRTYETIKFPIQTGNNPPILAGFTMDVTERRRAEEKLSYLSQHDHLSGLYNRAYFDAELARAARGRRFPLCIVVADLDGLKQINDTFGHESGDKLIIGAAMVLREVLRGDDIVARTGGDEFVSIIYAMEESEAFRAIDRIRICESAYNKKNGAPEVKLSLGLAIAKSAQEIYVAWKAADQAMYINKRDRKALYEQ